MENPLKRWRDYLQDQKKIPILGRQGRSARAKREQYQLYRRALSVVLRYLPGLLHELPDTRGFEGLWPQVLEKMAEVYRQQSEFKRGVQFLLGCLHEGNRNGIWQLPLPAIPLTIQRTPSRYDESFFEQARQCARAHQAWLEKIRNRTAKQVSDETLMLDILHCAVFYSGVHQLPILHALMRAIEAKAPLCGNGQQLWLPLTVRHEGMATNFHDDQGNAVTQRQIFLTLPLQGLLYRWYRRRNGTFSLPKQLDGFSGWASVRLVSPLRSIKSFCQAATVWSSIQPGVQWPQILTHAASGFFKQVPLPHEHWLSLHHPALPAESQLSLNPPSDLDEDLGRLDPGRRYHGKDRAYSPLLSRLRLLFAEKIDTTHKTTSRACISGLETLLSDHQLSQPEQILTDWLLDGLKVRHHKPATARSYLGRGGQQWLNECYGQALRDWSGEDFLLRYRALLEEYQSDSVVEVELDEYGPADEQSPDVADNATDRPDVAPKNVRYIAERLSHLHRFGVLKYGLAPLPEELLSRVRVTPHVRAAYISEPQFRLLLRSIERMSELSPRHRECLLALYIVAFRAGLRLGEILKLRLRDIEQGQELLVEIRNTRLDDGKSASATRRIHLGALLTEDERQRLDAYLSPLWSRIKQSTQALAFPSEQGVLIPLTPAEVTGPLTSLLQQITGVHLTFHHLRHTALSRLQLVLHHAVLGIHHWSGWQHFFPWNAKQCEQIRQVIAYGHGRADYWGLAEFAGHLTPETTLNNYLHFSDLVSAACLTQARHDWDPAIRHYFTGQSQATLQKLGWMQGCLTSERCQDVLRSSLAPYLNEISWKITELPPLSPQVKLKLDFFALLDLLTMMVRRENMRQMLDRYEVTPAELTQWMQKLFVLRTFMTQRYRSRLLSPSRKAMLPGDLRSYAEKFELVRVVEQARDIYRSRKEELITWIGYLLVRSNSHNTELPFTEPDLLLRFLSVTLELVPASRIAITVMCGTEQSGRDTWRRAIKSKAIRVEYLDRSGSHRALLRVIHPDEEGILQRILARQQPGKQPILYRRYSTPLLRTLGFVLALRLLSVEELQQLRTKKKRDFLSR